jgi:hypothetical protein
MKATAKATMIDDTMRTAQFMSGGAWPSADMTRWALENLAKKLADHVLDVYETRKGPVVLRDELLRVCGLFMRR